jgi:hypothetical protein
MPRFVGRQSNVGSYIASFFILFVVTGGLLQYLGVINISSLSKETQELFKKSERLDQPVVALIGQKIEGQESVDA